MKKGNKGDSAKKEQKQVKSIDLAKEKQFAGIKAAVIRYGEQKKTLSYWIREILREIPEIADICPTIPVILQYAKENDSMYQYMLKGQTETGSFIIQRYFYLKRDEKGLIRDKEGKTIRTGKFSFSIGNVLRSIIRNEDSLMKKYQAIVSAGQKKENKPSKVAA